MEIKQTSIKEISLLEAFIEIDKEQIKENEIKGKRQGLKMLVGGLIGVGTGTYLQNEFLSYSSLAMLAIDFDIIALRCIYEKLKKYGIEYYEQKILKLNQQTSAF